MSTVALRSGCSNLFTARLDFGQPRHCQNIFQLDLCKHHNSLFLSFKKMVCHVFWTGSEYNYAQFHCLDLHLWLANFKICQNFVWVTLVRGGSRVVQVISRNHSNVFKPAFVTPQVLYCKSRNQLSSFYFLL